MINTPIYRGRAQSDIDFAGFDALNVGNWPTGSGSSSDVINVKDAPYSATGNGVTDDTAAIQAAINAAGAAGGGVVYFPKGVYLCNGPFDATTNSILRFPYVPILESPGVYGSPVTIELRGESPAAVAARPLVNGSIIKTTKTGTGTGPAILAAHSYLGRSVVIDFTTTFSYVQAVIRNLHFQVPADPTIWGLRLDTAVMGILEDVVVATAATGVGIAGIYPEPTHAGIVGIFNPAVGNFATNYMNRVWAQGFDIGMVTCDHLRAPQINLLNCHLGVEFLTNVQMSWANILIDHCNMALKFSKIDATIDKTSVVLNIGEEQMDTGWQTPTGVQISDPDNVVHGEIRYYCHRLGSTTPREVGITGGAHLSLMNLGTGHRFIGPDMKLVPITGGAKLQVRNPGTGLWADADQWTNP